MYSIYKSYQNYMIYFEKKCILATSEVNTETKIPRVKAWSAIDPKKCEGLVKYMTDTNRVIVKIKDGNTSY